MSAATPFRLASHLTAYPEPAFLARLRSGVEDCHAGESRAGGEAWRALEALCTDLHEREVEELRADYIDLRSLAWNYESNLNVFDRGFAGEMLAMFERDIARSRRLHAAEWARRPWSEKLRELVYGLADWQY